MGKDRSLFKRLLIYLVLLILIAFVIYIYPYYKKPPASFEELDAIYENYFDNAQAISERPEHDRRMIEQLMVRFDKIKNKGVTHFVLDSTPPYDLNRIKSNQGYIDKITFLDPMFKALVKNRVIIRQGLEPEAKQLSFGLMFDFFDLQMAMAILDVERGNFQMATDRILNSLKFANGLLDSSYMLYVLVGSRILQTIDETVIYLHPRLKTKQLMQIHQARTNGPDRMVSFFDSLAIETVILVETLKKSPKTKLDGIYLSGPCENWKYLLTHPRCYCDALRGAVVYLPKVLKRQEYGIIYYFSQMEKSFRLWARGGATGAAPGISSVLRSQMEHYPVTKALSPNLSGIASKMGKYNSKNKAVTSAIRAEIQRRHIPTEFEYADGKKIVRHDSYGAIE